MSSQPRHSLLTFALALCLLFAQFAVAAHGTVHPLEDIDTPHSQVCQHLSGHGLGSALPATHHFDAGAGFTQATGAPPVVPHPPDRAWFYCARAPPGV